MEVICQWESVELLPKTCCNDVIIRSMLGRTTYNKVKPRRNILLDSRT